jgi:hypothetical protein
MRFEWWSWSSYILGVISALLPSAVAFLYFAWRPPVMDEGDARTAREKDARIDTEAKGKVGGS